jgi:flagella basal body P-ring formation protein FlgA
MSLEPRAMRRQSELLSGFGRAALVGILAFAAGALTLRANAEDASGPWHSPADIAAAARDAISGAGRVEAVAVDDRLKLKRCDLPLAAEVTRPIQRGNGMVAVRCEGSTPWRLFVPVRATDPVTVVVAARALKPGEVLTAADLALEQRSSSALPFDFLADVEKVLGLTVRRTQAAGVALSQTALEYPEVVARGALVTLVSTSGTITVKSEGVALEPGRLRQRVRVRSASGRVVEGTAEGPGQVRVGFR